MSDPTRDQLMQALRNADAAGDTAAAQAIARRLSAPAPTAAPAQPPEFQRAGVGNNPVVSGLADFGIKSALGVKQFFGGLSDENRAVLREMETEAKADPRSGMRTAGEVGANIALSAIPGAAAARGMTSAIAAAPKVVSALAPTLAAAGTSGAQSALLTPGEGDTYGQQMTSKGKQALTDAAIGGAFGGLFQGGGKLATGLFEATPEAKKLIAQGITPPIQKATDNPVAKLVGTMGSDLVGTAPRNNQEAMAAFLRRMGPGSDVSAAAPTADNLKALDKSFRADYGKVYGGKTYEVTDGARQAVWDAAMNPGNPNMQDASRQWISNALRNAGDAVSPEATGTRTMTNEGLQTARRAIQDQIDRLPRSDEVFVQQAREGLNNAKATFDSLVRDPALSPADKALKATIDPRYAMFKKYEDAASNPATKGQLDMADLLRSYSKADPTGGRQVARDVYPELDEIISPTIRMTSNDSDVKGAMGRRIVRGMAGLATMTGPIGAVGNTAPGAKVLLGETAKQKALAEYLRQAAPYVGSVTQSLIP